MQKKLVLTHLIVRRITSSIAFYPAIISASLSLFAIFFLWVEYQPWLMEIKPSLKFFLVKSIDDSRLLLGTLVAAVISLMVFSFSMVMIVLNQASNNLSPRIVPGLVTSIENQIVLGVYLGTICYCLLLILNIYPSTDPVRIPSVGVFVGLLLGLICLCLFTYFIHKISLSIQVDNIVTDLYRQTKRQVKRCVGEPETELPEREYPHTLHSVASGYLKWIDKSTLLKICIKHNLHLKVNAHIGAFLVKQSDYIKLDEPVDEEVEQSIHQCFLFYAEEKLDDHFSFGFKQISEIAVKALSPALNDPSTAIKCIDILTDLFIEKCQYAEETQLVDEQKEVRVVLIPIDTELLMRWAIEPIVWHGRNDPIVLTHLLNNLRIIESHLTDNGDQKIAARYIQRIAHERQNLINSAE